MLVRPKLRLPAPASLLTKKTLIWGVLCVLVVVVVSAVFLPRKELVVLLEETPAEVLQIAIPQPTPPPDTDGPRVTVTSFSKSEGSQVSIQSESELFHVVPEETSLKLSGVLDGKNFSATFNNFSGAVIVKGQRIIGGHVAFVAPSLSSSDDVALHLLMAPQALNVGRSQLLIFDLFSFDNFATETVVEGQLIVKGVRYPISFPVSRVGNQYQTKFTLNAPKLNILEPGLDPEIVVEATFAWN